MYRREREGKTAGFKREEGTTEVRRVEKPGEPGNTEHSIGAAAYKGKLREDVHKAVEARKDLYVQWRGQRGR